MKITRPLWKAFSSETLPITTKEFGDELARIWRPRPAPGGPQRQETIGERLQMNLLHGQLEADISFQAWQ